MNPINYAAQYAQALANAYPYVLHFGALYATPNNGRYRMGEDGKTIYIPTIRTGGRIPGNRDTIAHAVRNYDNNWEPKVLMNERKWSTLVHPKDIDQTNQVASIVNITQTMNETQKFPEMDAYCVSSIYKQYVAAGNTPDHTVLSASNVLDVFDAFMESMDEDNVPVDGRILYVSTAVNTMLKHAQEITRNFDVQSGRTAINRKVSRIEEVEIVSVPQKIMRTEFDFSEGWKQVDGADQINMMLVHPSAIITPISYQFAQLDPPSAVTEGKYVYYEESFEDVFILNERTGAIRFNTTVKTSQDNTLKDLKLGALTLTPEFAKGTVAYTAATTDATNKVTATAADADAKVEIKLGGTSQGTGTGALEKTITWAAGSNTLTVEVTTSAGTKTYTVTVTKS